MPQKDEFSVLYARLDDLCHASERGEIGISSFLSPREQNFALRYLSKKGMKDICFMYGGYDGAERCRALVLPDYISYPENFSDIEVFFDEPPISALLIEGSGYRSLTHRDYLGALLGLGIERDVLGDIVFCGTEDQEAVVFCDRVIADFIVSELRKVSSDTVKVKPFDLPENFSPERSFVHISDTVASARIDCIVAALCSLSREKATTAVSSGLVEIDFECETRPDRLVSAPALVSIRGYGKFRVNSVSELTRRGRIRLSADKYV